MLAQTRYQKRLEGIEGRRRSALRPEASAEHFRIRSLSRDSNAARRMECCPGALNRQISLNISLEASKCEKPETAQPVQRSSTYVRLTHQCSRKKCKGIVLVVEAAMLSAVDGHCNAGCSSPSEFSEASFSCCVEVKRHPCPRHCRQGAKFAMSPPKGAALVAAMNP